MKIFPFLYCYNLVVLGLDFSHSENSMYVPLYSIGVC